MKKNTLIITSFMIIVILSLLSIILGSVKIPLSEIGKDTYRYIIVKMRIPRTVSAVFVGAGLALSGLIFQSVFKNPMADSYMLGISSSASFTVCLALLVLKSLTKSITLSIFAFIGSIICSLFLFFSSKKNTFKLLLTGIALNFFFSAGTTLLICLNRQQLDTILFWTMGSLANLNWTKVSIIAAVTVITLIIELKEKYTLDLLLLDELSARSSGIDVDKKRIQLLVLASINTSVIVAFCGVIGFIGMLSSHVVRLLIGPSHGKLIFPAALFGSILLLMSDLISRTVIAPSELPIGVISSVLGAPILFILIRRNKTWIH